MSPWLLVAGSVATLGALLGVFHVGRVYERAGFIEADLKRVERVVVKKEILVREVPKIVERVVVREKEVLKEVERVVTVSEKLLDPDCIMPSDFGLLLVAAANGVDPEAAGGVDAFRGGYGCRQTLAAILDDLQSGWRNSARLEGLQEWAKLVTDEAREGK